MIKFIPLLSDYVGDDRDIITTVVVVSGSKIFHLALLIERVSDLKSIVGTAVFN